MMQYSHPRQRARKPEIQPQQSARTCPSPSKSQRPRNRPSCKRSRHAPRIFIFFSKIIEVSSRKVHDVKYALFHSKEINKTISKTSTTEHQPLHLYKITNHTNRNTDLPTYIPDHPSPYLRLPPHISIPTMFRNHNHSDKMREREQEQEQERAQAREEPRELYLGEEGEEGGGHVMLYAMRKAAALRLAIMFGGAVG